MSQDFDHKQSEFEDLPFQQQMRIFAAEKYSEWHEKRYPIQKADSIDEFLRAGELKTQETIKKWELREKSFLDKLKLPGRKGPRLQSRQILSKTRKEALIELIRIDPHNLREPLIHAQIVPLRQIVIDTPNKDSRDKAKEILRAIGEALVPQGPIRESRSETWFPAHHPTYLMTYFEELYRWEEARKMKRNGELYRFR